MKSILKFKTHSLIVIFIFMANIMYAQRNIIASTPGETNYYFQEDDEPTNQKGKKKHDSFKVFGGITFNELSMDEKIVDPTLAIGWLVGASYKRGGFFYWGIGATYNNYVYNLLDTALIPGSLLDGVFSVRNIDIPITVGFDFLFFINRIVGLRAYVSAVPAFAIGVDNNKLGISKDNINVFNFYGQGGIGVDVLFIFVEAGYNYGFIDLFQNDIKSNSNQIFVNLGFRF